MEFGFSSSLAQVQPIGCMTVSITSCVEHALRMNLNRMFETYPKDEFKQLFRACLKDESKHTA